MDLSPAEAAGKKLYMTGKGASDQPVTALMSGVSVPATVMPCVNCHGKKGLGQSGGEMAPPNITWKALSHATESADRQRPSYTEKTLKRAITMGLNPDGEALKQVMPRYQMTMEDMTNLLAYLKQL